MTNRPTTQIKIRKVLATAALAISAAGASAVISGCDLSQTNFGGTGDLASMVANQVISSPALVARVRPVNAQVNAGNITLLQNSVTSFTDSPGPIDFVPDVANLGSLAGGLIHLAPPGANQFFQSTLGLSLFFNSGTIFVVAKPSSRGELVNINPSSRTSQSLELKATATDVVAIFHSTISDSAQTNVTLPATPLMIVGASFASDSNLIDLSVNGALAPAVTITGVPAVPQLLTRKISLGSSTSGDQQDIQDILIFNRALTKSEHGAVLRYLANLYGMTLTYDPALTVYSGSASDPAFYAAQAIIENKCVSCHAGWSGAAAALYLSNGEVVKGDALSSKLYYRLAGSDGSSGPKEMPKNGSVLSGDELSTIKTWINGMK